MGRSYQKEITFLNSTYKHALSEKIEIIKSFIQNSYHCPLISVGSGGSLSSAIFTSLLHQRTGNISQHQTPLEFIFSDIELIDKSVLLISAGGSNNDILNSFDNVVKRQPRNLGVLCGNKGSNLERRSKRYDEVYYELCNLPNGKDGYLAVNSLLAFTTIIARAYNDIFQELNFPESIDKLLSNEIKKDQYLFNLQNVINNVINKTTFLVLYGKWGKPAAFDLESKFVEGALGNIQLADYRNFGHGRHYWLAKKGSETCVINLLTPEDKDIAEKTIKLIPKKVPKIKLISKYTGPIGALNLILQAIYFVGIFGELINVDPGRPKVPEFGKKIYKINMMSKKKAFYKTEIENISYNILLAIKKKVTNKYLIQNNYNLLYHWINNYRNFVSKIESNQYGAIVFDYDGTLCSPFHRETGIDVFIKDQLIKLLEKDIFIGIATGRGKSIRKDLQQKIPKNYWSKVLIGYYNGSDIALLSNNKRPLKNIEIDGTLKILYNQLNNNEYIKYISHYELRPYQISIIPEKYVSKNEIRRVLIDIVKSNKLMSVEILESDHSLDVLAPKISKVSVVEKIQKKINNEHDQSSILVIGDKGRWPGNDYYLLNTKYSLSVDTVSSNPNTCWNLASEGRKGILATIDYLNALTILNRKFLLKIKDISGFNE